MVQRKELGKNVVTVIMEIQIFFFFKGSDRLCKVVELSMQGCEKLLSDSFETYQTFQRSVNPEFERNSTLKTPMPLGKFTSMNMLLITNDIVY